MKKFLQSIWKLVYDYPAVATAVVIYLYYLLTSLDFFEHAREKRTLLDYVLQFDSLIWMWLAAAAFIQLQKYKKRQHEETEKRMVYQHEIKLQQAQNDMLNDITALLQDSINNPLAIISLKMQEMRRKFERDEDLVRSLESVEGALRRIELTIRDLKSYEMQKMMKTSAERLDTAGPAPQ